MRFSTKRRRIPAWMLPGAQPHAERLGATRIHVDSPLDSPSRRIERCSLRHHNTASTAKLEVLPLVWCSCSSRDVLASEGQLNAVLRAQDCVQATLFEID